MKSQATLPVGYKEILSVDLQKDKRLMLAVNGAAIAIAAIMAVIGIMIRPISLSLGSEGLNRLMISLVIISVGTVVYMVLHEAVHDIFMRCFSEVKPHFGFTGIYAYAGSDAYYGKLPYIIIALAPVVIWGIVLLVLNIFIPAFFWPIYFIQITNISGAAGDFYVTLKFMKLPADILVRDTGVSMTVYAPYGEPTEPATQEAEEVAHEDTISSESDSADGE